MSQVQTHLFRFKYFFIFLIRLGVKNEAIRVY